MTVELTARDREGDDWTWWFTDEGNHVTFEGDYLVMQDPDNKGTEDEPKFLVLSLTDFVFVSGHDGDPPEQEEE